MHAFLFCLSHTFFVGSISFLFLSLPISLADLFFYFRMTFSAHTHDLFFCCRMDSYVLAEMFKYLYLLFAEKEDLIIDIDDFIFTTEAHLLPLTLSIGNITSPVPKVCLFVCLSVSKIPLSLQLTVLLSLILGSKEWNWCQKSHFHAKKQAKHPR